MTGPSEWVQQGRSRAVSPRGPLRGCHVLWEQHHGPAELTLHGLYLKEPVPCSFFRTGLTWHSLRTTLSNPKAIWAQRLSQHAAQDRLWPSERRGSAQQLQTRLYKRPQGFCLCFCFAAAPQLPPWGWDTSAGRGEGRVAKFSPGQNRAVPVQEGIKSLVAAPR